MKPSSSVKPSAATGPVRRHLGFAGRATRRKFWPVASIMTLLLLAAGIAIPPLGAILALALFLPLASASTRRLHDAGLSGLWLLPLIVIPFLMLVVLVMGNSLFTLILLAAIDETISESDIRDVCIAAETTMAWAFGGYMLLALVALGWKGSDGPNRFGPDPRRGPPEGAGPSATGWDQSASDWRLPPTDIVRRRSQD